MFVALYSVVLYRMGPSRGQSYKETSQHDFGKSLGSEWKELPARIQNIEYRIQDNASGRCYISRLGFGRDRVKGQATKVIYIEEYWCIAEYDRIYRFKCYSCDLG